MTIATGWVKYAGIFIAVVVLFAAAAELYPEASDAGDELNASNMCEDAGCSYNGSRTIVCTANNATGQDTTHCATGYGDNGFPLSTLFAGGGVVFVILAAGLLFFVVKKGNV